MKLRVQASHKIPDTEGKHCFKAVINPFNMHVSYTGDSSQYFQGCLLLLFLYSWFLLSLEKVPRHILYFILQFCTDMHLLIQPSQFIMVLIMKCEL